MNLSGSYSHMLVNSGLLPVNSDLSLVNSDLSPVNSDLSLLSIRESILSWHICLSINLYPRSYHNLADQSYPHTAHAHGLLHNYYIERNIK